MLFADDYVPEVPTSKWEKGKEYTAKRRIYIPKFIDEFDPQFKGEETLRLSVGLFNPYDRTGQSEKEVLTKKLTVVPPPIGTPEVIYESGWAVARDCPSPELACELARYLAGPESQRRRGEMGLAISANRAVAEAIASGDPNERAFISEVQYGRAPWGTRISDYSVVENLLSEATERVLLGYADAATACREVAKLIDDELAMM